MLYSLFSKHVQATPDHVAVVWRDESVSYAQLDALVRCWLDAMQQEGVAAGDTVALLVPNSLHFVVGVLAAWANGNLLLPLNVGYKPEEVQLYCENAGARFVFAARQCEHLLPASVTGRFLIDLDAPLVPTEASGQPVFVDATMPAVVMFSSGSTGTPKQVVRTQGQLVAEQRNAAETLGLCAADVIMSSVPLFHSHGFGNTFMAAILNGGSLLIHAGEFNPRKVMRMIAEHRATIYPSVPFMCKILAATPFKEMPDLGSLRLVFTAGAPLDEQIFSDFRQRFGIAIGQLYGSTETGAAAINTQPDADNFRTVGRPLAGTSIRLVDDDGCDVHVGQDGEVVILSDAMATEYRGLPELSAESFQADGYHTGDLGRFDEHGNITICGRKKLMINVAGYKVDPADVEKLIAQLPGVQEVVVLGKPDPDYGEAVKAAIVSDGTVTREAVTALCAQHLAEYKVPKIIEFVAEIPKSPLGKILRKYL